MRDQDYLHLPPGIGDLEGMESRVLIYDTGISFHENAPDFSHHTQSQKYVLNDLPAGFIELQSPGEIITYSCSMKDYSPGLERDCFLEKKTSGDDTGQQKRKRCTQAHSLNERLRRQRIKEKTEALQDLIPYCHKRDKASTLDDAIKHIKALHHQLQMVSMGAGFSKLPSPPLMTPQSTAHQQGLLIHRVPPFLHTVPQDEAGIGITNTYSPFNFPPSQLELPNLHIFTSDGTLSSSEAQLSQKPMECLDQPITGYTHQAAMSQVVSESSSGCRGSTAEGLPIYVIPCTLPHDDDKEINDIKCTQFY